MLTSLLARSASAGMIVIAVAVYAFGSATPTADAAQSTSAASLQLAQGVGMGPRPSVRVRRLQRIVDRAGFNVGPTGIDGRFGPRTAAAVRRMQSAYGLVPDGVVGTKTRRLVGLIADRQSPRRSSQGGTPNRRGNRPGTDRRAQPAPAAPSTTPPTATQPTTSQPTTAQPSNTQTQTAPSQAPADQPANQTPAAGSDWPVDTVIIGVLSALATAVIALLALRLRRMDRSPDIVPIGRDLYLEGESDDPGVGAFAGYALATAVPAGHGGTPSEGARFLVHDPRKPAPVWVRQTEVKHTPAPEVADGDPVIGYVVSDRRGAPSRKSLERLESLCHEAGLELHSVVHDKESPDLLRRPGLTHALEQIRAGEARGVVVADVKRLAPSLSDLAVLVDTFRNAGAVLIVPELELNTAKPEGDRMASVLVTLDYWQQQRTRRGGALQAVRDPGPTGGAS
jgi:peptidoglycan hydrolase-like protein with peptidoglycan-binding domain